MPLKTHIIKLNEFVQMNLLAQILGECYAYDDKGVTENSKSENVAIHNLFLNRTIAGLWKASPKFNVFVFYEMYNEICRLFICSRKKLSNAFFEQVHPLLESIGGYIECGYDKTDLSRIRPILAWEPPSDMYAIWPRGFEGETDGFRVIDSGTLLGYFSSDSEQTYRNIQKGLIDNLVYLCVPVESESEFQLNGKTYHYLNRYYELQP
ncbi:MAG: hypothetical protein PHQ00_06825 [Phycisphaerae bacterium]|nr:hypothetical protein [Phycisphaerae bacterium]